MANGVTTAPSWDQLLNIGIGYVKEQQPAWIFIAVTVALQFLLGLVASSPALSILLSLVAMVAGVYLTLMLSRHALTGEWGLKDSDHPSALRIIGMVILVVFGASLGGGLLIGLLVAALGVVGAVIGGVALVLLILWLVARFGFYVPALSVEHPTSLGQAFAQSEPYWARLMAVMVGPGLIALAINYLLATLISGPFGLVLAAIIGGFVVAVGQAITIAAVAYLYANFVRSAQPQ